MFLRTPIIFNSSPPPFSFKYIQCPQGQCQICLFLWTASSSNISGSFLYVLGGLIPLVLDFLWVNYDKAIGGLVLSACVPGGESPSNGQSLDAGKKPQILDHTHQKSSLFYLKLEKMRNTVFCPFQWNAVTLEWEMVGEGAHLFGHTCME